ncbi:hypothetical protein BV22DRAFT_1043298 [Leucogyrophana mollusca]|uniref:Uncharacterized protein n=1 Tax=Leucogyrophana mollusca TaxID=85980 RepID=A0ACB8BXC9_9AGAM|nr:hypothetical protein BV22DRAFT_1043298 [Leucogyrophana mollusca]
MRSTTTALAFLALAGFASAACQTSHGDYSEKFLMKLYPETSCRGKAAVYSYPKVSTICACHNVSHALNDKVRSFVYTSKHEVNLYRDAGCHGPALALSSGSHFGNWPNNDLTSRERPMSSFQVC